MSSKPKVVVAALIRDPEGRVLLVRRRADQPMPLLWELPGGKLEPGESPQEALTRELKEEIGVEPQVGPPWDIVFHRYPEFDLLMLVYSCELAALEQPRALEVADLAFVAPERLVEYELLPADAPLAARLISERPGAPG